MSMPTHSVGLGGMLGNVRLVHMDSKHAEREPPQPDLWQVTVEGYMVGQPVSPGEAMQLKRWLEDGALRDICNLLSPRESGGSNA